MSKKNTETNDVVTTEEETQAVNETEQTESKTSSKEKYLNAASIAMVVGVSIFVAGALYFDDLNKLVSNTADTATTQATDTVAMESSTALTNEEQNAVATAATQTAPAFATSPYAISSNNTYQDMVKQQRENIARNLEQQRKFMAAAQQQHQEMMRNAYQPQVFHPAAMQQQTPMMKAMEEHRIEVMKQMEQRHQQFLKEMNEARASYQKS